MKILFLIISCSTGLICLALAFLLGMKPRLKNAPRLAREPRLVGTIVGAGCLVWAAYYGVQMLEGDLEKFRIYVWCLVPVIIVLSYFLLDYINARVLGGLLTLCANHLINGAFVFDVPFRGFYSILCLLLGVFGMVGLGLPWRYRDLVEQSNKKDAVGKTCLAVFGIIGIALLTMPWAARL